MLIEVSGIDGSGKTTVLQLIRRDLLEDGEPAWERSLRSVQRLVFADLAAGEGHKHWSAVFSPNEVEMTHAFEMVQEVRRQIEPIDLRRQHVVTDTYVRRWLATAQMWRPTNMDNLVRVYGALAPPVVSIHLVVDPDLAFARIHARPQGDSLLKMGSVTKLVDYADAFDAVEDRVQYPSHAVDANRPLEAVMADVREVVRAAREAVVSPGAR